MYDIVFPSPAAGGDADAADHGLDNPGEHAGDLCDSPPASSTHIYGLPKRKLSSFLSVSSEFFRRRMGGEETGVQERSFVYFLRPSPLPVAGQLY